MVAIRACFFILGISFPLEAECASRALSASCQTWAARIISRNSPTAGGAPPSYSDIQMFEREKDSLKIFTDEAGEYLPHPALRLLEQGAGGGEVGGGGGVGDEAGEALRGIVAGEALPEAQAQDVGEVVV